MLTKWESLFLMFMTLPIMGHVVLLPMLLDVAGRDAWISALLSLPVGFLMAWAIFKFRNKQPGHIRYFFAVLADMVRIAYFPETPIWALILWFMIFCFYAASKGIKTVALTAGILSFIALVTGHSITLLDTPSKDWRNLKPIMEFGWSPVIWRSVIICSIWIELLFLMFIPLQNPKEKKLFMLWIVGLLANGLMIISTSTGSITIFGLGQADNFTYPSLEVVRILSLGFIDRFDVYAMTLMTLGCYIRSSLYFRLSCDLMLLGRLDKKWLKNLLLTGMGTVVVLAILYVSKQHTRLENLATYYAYCIVLLPIPFLLLMLSRFKEKRLKS